MAASTEIDQRDLALRKALGEQQGVYQQGQLEQGRERNRIDASQAATQAGLATHQGDLMDAQTKAWNEDRHFNKTASSYKNSQYKAYYDLVLKAREADPTLMIIQPGSKTAGPKMAELRRQAIEARIPVPPDPTEDQAILGEVQAEPKSGSVPGTGSPVVAPQPGGGRGGPAPATGTDHWGQPTGQPTRPR